MPGPERAGRARGKGRRAAATPGASRRPRDAQHGRRDAPRDARLGPDRFAALIPWLGVAVALALRLWALSRQPWVTVDGTEYVRFAEALTHGRGFLCLFPPGYPALIALFREVGAERVLAAQLVSLLCGALLPWPVWSLARRAVGERWAALPTLAVALHPTLALFSAIPMSESAYLLALLGGLALAALSRPLAAGLALGAAFAIRPEALVPAGALAAGAAVQMIRKKTPARTLALGALGFLVFAIPCWLYFHAAFGEWTLTPKLEALRAPSATWRLDEPHALPPRSAAERFGLVERIRQHGVEALVHYPGNAWGHLRSLVQLWPAPLLLLSLWGLTRRRGLETIPLLHLAAIPILGLSAQPRFVLSAIPSLAIAAAVPLGAVTGRGGRAMVLALWLAGGVWAVAGNAGALARSFDGYLAAHEEAGRWLAGVAEPGARVYDRKPYVAFYAGCDYRVMPDESYDAMLDAAVRDSVRYLVVDEAVVRIFRPQMLPLLFEPEFRDRERRLEMIWVGGHVRRYGIAVFRVLQPGEAKSGAPPVFAIRWLGRSGAAPPTGR